MATLFFLYFGTVIVLTSLLVVALRNPIYSVLALLVMFFHVAGLFVTLHAEFLAVVQIIVYAGAILVLYLFVVMILNPKHEDSYQRQVWLAVGLGLIALAEVIYVVTTTSLVETPLIGKATPMIASLTPSPLEGEGGGEGALAPAPLGNTEAIGQKLYTTYLFPFEVASLILLVAMIGAILLAKKGIMGPEGK